MVASWVSTFPAVDLPALTLSALQTTLPALVVKTCSPLAPVTTFARRLLDSEASKWAADALAAEAALSANTAPRARPMILMRVMVNYSLVDGLLTGLGARPLRLDRRRLVRLLSC